MIIALTGYMGSGKSSVGKVLATLLSSDFVDLDSYIVEREGRSIPEIFEKDGEPAFRRIERDCLMEVLASGRDMVLALGGGAVMTPACAEAIREHTTCFYLKGSVDTLMAHLSNSKGRPLLAGGPDREKITRMLELRSPVYENVCDHVINIDGLSVQLAARDIDMIINNTR